MATVNYTVIAGGGCPCGGYQGVKNKRVRLNLSNK